MQYAYATLSRSGLGLWLYFNKNQDDYQLELSQKACAEWGIKKDSYSEHAEGIRTFHTEQRYVDLKARRHA